MFIVDTDELPWVGLAYPGFDAYIADGLSRTSSPTTYLDAWQHQHWAPHLEHHARTNFRGFKALDYQDARARRRCARRTERDGRDPRRTSDLSPEDFDELKS